MNSFIEEIYRTGVVRDETGKEYELHSSVDRFESEFLSKLIKSDPDIRKTLEIGCAFGLSSLSICSALAERESAKHLIIDPSQSGYWHGVGIANLRRGGFDFFKLIEKPSEFILPEIAQNEPSSFDLVFIDGWHTLDHTLLDLFYANRLVKVGGLIVVDDCNLSSVANAVSYFSKYPAYQLLNQELPKSRVSTKKRLGNIVSSVLPPSVAIRILPTYIYNKYYIRTIYSSMVVLKKVAIDERNWNWFEPF